MKVEFIMLRALFKKHFLFLAVFFLMLCCVSSPVFAHGSGGDKLQECSSDEDITCCDLIYFQGWVDSVTEYRKKCFDIPHKDVSAYPPKGSKNESSYTGESDRFICFELPLPVKVGESEKEGVTILVDLENGYMVGVKANKGWCFILPENNEYNEACMEEIKRKTGVKSVEPLRSVGIHYAKDFDENITIGCCQFFNAVQGLIKLKDSKKNDRQEKAQQLCVDTFVYCIIEAARFPEIEKDLEKMFKSGLCVKVRGCVRDYNKICKAVLQPIKTTKDNEEIPRCQNR
ncbi:MAG: hypothetical protein ACD_21C00227G0003 [uncultured bacterium]|nr:MAG: hypothetical protein ACD_21C00227G0003 [uncultured bacterium]HBY55819.1 hypothetical protein [Coxiellaceae bacterium]